MFSQFRQAVEQLAQQVPVPHADGERRSLDIQSLASGQLAGDALTSLRKSLSQRSGSSDATIASSSPPNPNGKASPSSSNSNPNNARKSTLEERLRRATHHAITEGSSSASSSYIRCLRPLIGRCIQTNRPSEDVLHPVSPEDG